MTPAQVAIRVEGRARELGLETYPSHMSVYRVLNPLIEHKEKKQKVRNAGWHGSQVSHQTRAGQTLEPRYSNHTWQCDHTKLAKAVQGIAVAAGRVRQGVRSLSVSNGWTQIAIALNLVTLLQRSRLADGKLTGLLHLG